MEMLILTAFLIAGLSMEIKEKQKKDYIVFQNAGNRQNFVKTIFPKCA